MPVINVPSDDSAEYEIILLTTASEETLEVLTQSTSHETEERIYMIRQYDVEARLHRVLAEGSNLQSLKQCVEQNEFHRFGAGTIAGDIFIAAAQ